MDKGLVRIGASTGRESWCGQRLCEKNSLQLILCCYMVASNIAIAIIPIVIVELRISLGA